MDALKLGFILLLPLTACSQDLGGETVVKTIGKQPDVTQICSNETETLTLIVCTIRTQISGGRECRLLFQHGQDFVHGCESRFTLMKENQTVFLHLINLTSEDSGTYTCQCTDLEGTHVLHLNVTVEDSGRSASTSIEIYFALTGVTVFIIVTLVLLGFIYRRLRHRKQPKPLSSAPNTRPEDIEPYSTFIRRESGLYSTVKVHDSKLNTNNSNVLTEEDPQLSQSL
ncbi:uncharacterized protein LOC115799181 [Archocentrus centrarchus]|uniref:uncharacterized protein LOC115799181 n=1 Tax=Archocentrus centrarchus TaxID=63155 RepID=UPI0011E9EC12|nr:uncharacterized protein LOC115799181 [Archocentrus centrarchus]